MIKKDESAAHALYKMISEYGLAVNGHFWKDDLENMEWAGAADEIAGNETGLWIISGNKGDFTPSVIQGLSLLALSVRAKKAGQISVMILTDDVSAVSEKLSTPLAGAEVFAADNPVLGAKITARANMPMKKNDSEYRFNVYALPKIGLWIEAGPAEGAWEGVVFGAGSAGIDAMGIGPAGRIPEASTLEYPIRDMTLALGEREFSAWAASNTIAETESVYVRVKGNPEAFIFGPFDPSTSSLDVYTLLLR